MQTANISFPVIALLVFMALAFDFMNGFHDAANAIATVVSTRVMKPHTAVAMAAFCNVAAILFDHFEHFYYCLICTTVKWTPKCRNPR